MPKYIELNGGSLFNPVWQQEMDFGDKQSSPEPSATIARAESAAAMLLADDWRTRAFDDCFEEGDGADVVKLLTARAREQPPLRTAIQRACFTWLDAER